MNKDFRSHLLSYPYEHTEWVKVPFWVVTPFLDLQLRFVIVSLDLDSPKSFGSVPEEGAYALTIFAVGN